MNSGTRRLMSLWRQNDFNKNKDSQTNKEKNQPNDDQTGEHASNRQRAQQAKQNNCQVKTRSRLLSSKSLCQLIPENLSIRRFADSRKQTDGLKPKSSSNFPNDSKINDRLGTTKSFPSASFQYQIQSHRFHISGISSISPIVHSVENQSRPRNSGLPISSSIAQDFINESFELEEDAPEKAQLRDSVTDMSWIELGDPPVAREEKEHSSDKNDQSGDNQTSSSSTGSQGNKETIKRQGHMMKTATVLRDVKNSIGLRIKAKHESKAFKRFTNEVDTPPTKLYSPFNIYTEEEGDEDFGLDSQDKKTEQPKDEVKANENDDKKTNRLRSRARMALFGKRELQLREDSASFEYDSPNKRLRATVKDVEQSQKCIEDISRAIEGRKRLMN